MNILITAFRLAIQALLAYKIRTFLTMLGMIIGIASVIVMMSIGKGANKRVQEQFDNMGSNMIFVFSGSTKKGGVRGGYGSRFTLRVKDASAIANEATAIETVSYFSSLRTQLVLGNKNWQTRVSGTTPGYQHIRNLTLREGSFITPQHLRSAASVAVLGATIVENLIPPGEPVLGQTIRIRNVPFRIVGVLNKKGTSPGGKDQDDRVIIPYSNMMRRLSHTRIPGLIHIIMASARSRNLIQQAKLEIETILRRQHRILPGQADDFSARTLEEFSARAEEANKTMSFFFIAVATVSLLVGGIGIMNIMLVSVTERTREIGIRIAIGARERDILIQFLVEAITISFFGGIFGTLLGVGFANLVSFWAQWPTIVTLNSILIATLFSGSVGIFFGFYPARKASRLDPIQALSYD
ncbi:MAG: FtsX-like permease family protein [Deltaproteobacteria bacterium]|nr:FtsX-like permease family protein [Deltaproteobacteria bacterium]